MLSNRLGWKNLAPQVVSALGILIAGACSSGSGPGNLLAAQGACDSAPFGDDPSCACCGTNPRGCSVGSTCAPAGAAQACGSRCPSDMVCYPDSKTYEATSTGLVDYSGTCENVRKVGNSCSQWGINNTQSDCASGLSCSSYNSAYGEYDCQTCKAPGVSCSNSDTTPCCPCPGSDWATCEQGVCSCPVTNSSASTGTGGAYSKSTGAGGRGSVASNTGGYATYGSTGGTSSYSTATTWSAPACPNDSKYPCSCSGYVCDDGSPCVKTGGTLGICSLDCSSGTTCSTSYAAPSANPSCELDLSSSDMSFVGCIIRCSTSSQCPSGQTCRTATSGQVCLP
jgi:hypothetical protein